MNRLMRYRLSILMKVCGVDLQENKTANFQTTVSSALTRDHAERTSASKTIKLRRIKIK